MNSVPDAVRVHLEAWFGGWNPRSSGIVVVESDLRAKAGWDGKVLPLVGLAKGDWAIVSVAPGQANEVARHVHGRNVDELVDVLELMTALFRWNLHVAPGDDTGEWVATSDPRVPAWLRPFNGDVLVAWDDDGLYGAGVGRKMHNAFGHEISVGTEEALRGRGIARRLVTTAARRIQAEGAVPTYVHLLDNVASSKVAEACGFVDLGWRYLAPPENS